MLLLYTECSFILKGNVTLLMSTCNVKGISQLKKMWFNVATGNENCNGDEKQTDM
jgi:hypothetical protein